MTLRDPTPSLTPPLHPRSGECRVNGAFCDDNQGFCPPNPARGNSKLGVRKGQASVAKQKWGHTAASIFDTAMAMDEEELKVALRNLNG